MSTVYNFVPPLVAPFQFQPTLDNNVYTGVVTWLTYGQRLYITLTAMDGTRIFTLPFIGSAAGLALQSLSWSNGVMTAQTMVPHGYNITDTVNLVVADCLPDTLNGPVQALITGPMTMQWSVASDPGAPTLLGHIDYQENLAAGYFVNSTLVFNDDAQQIIVTP